ncbi:hypothetical protein C8Q73DRAFT_131566 [Cubamyces lactineus]|nr:hypothetical protein C8Q73DRAFT_131566 [Cubamyces lactineus]
MFAAPLRYRLSRAVVSPHLPDLPSHPDYSPMRGRRGRRSSRSSRLSTRGRRSHSPMMTPSSFTLPASQASSVTSSPSAYPRSDAHLKTALSESRSLMTYDGDGTLVPVAYPCDTKGTPIPIDKLIAYNRSHHFLDVLSCFCEHVYGRPRPVRILKPRGGEHEGDICLGCPDWQADGIDPDSGRPAGCRYWVNVSRKFASGWEGIKMVQYPARYGRYLSKCLLMSTFTSS